MTPRKGFTFIELLISSAIFLVIISSLYIAFNTGVFGYNNIEETLTLNQNAKKILDHLNQDLRNSFSYKADETKTVGTNNSLSFLTLVDRAVEGEKTLDFASLVYRLSDKKIVRSQAKARESLKAEPEKKFEEFFPFAEELIFSYGYLEGAENTLKWKETWEGNNAANLILAAVKVKLRLKNKNQEEFARTIYLPL